MHRTESKSSPRRIESNHKQCKALELRKDGHHFKYIAEKLGYKSQQAAHWAVMAALRKTLQEPADELRKLELERLDFMWTKIHPYISSGDTQAINCAIKIMERRARLLGLDAPVRQEVTGRAGGPIEVKDVNGWTSLADEQLEAAIEEAERQLSQAL